MTKMSQISRGMKSKYMHATGEASAQDFIFKLHVYIVI